MAMAEPDKSQQPRASFWSPARVARASMLSHFLLIFSGHCCRAGLEVEQSGHKLEPMQGAGASDMALVILPQCQPCILILKITHCLISVSVSFYLDLLTFLPISLIIIVSYNPLCSSWLDLLLSEGHPLVVLSIFEIFL